MLVVEVKQQLDAAQREVIKEQLANVGIRLTVGTGRGETEWIGYIVQIKFDDPHRVIFRYASGVKPLNEREFKGFVFAKEKSGRYVLNKPKKPKQKGK